MEKGTYTFAMIKPHAVKEGKVGAILSMIENAGYKIEKLEMDQLELEDAQVFYEIHEEKPFYDGLCKIMSEGSVVAMVLTNPGLKENIVDEFRKFIGATDPTKAENGTIRKLYGKNLDYNAIHASDSVDNADDESSFFFYMGDEDDDIFEDENMCCGGGCNQ